ncbi:hypothetical protein ACFVIM_22575 [Streptomyces sp. NPDC057638]|uniref:hypothetical protein n=1 Tax=Streptomyces sp. NPDC057638 TaxID=3346190 RepID=UPI00368926E7
MTSDETSPREWVNPQYRDLVAHFRNEVRTTATRRGSTSCGVCHGLRVFVMADLSTRTPFSVSCLACNPGED